MRKLAGTEFGKYADAKKQMPLLIVFRPSLRPLSMMIGIAVLLAVGSTLTASASGERIVIPPEGIPSIVFGYGEVLSPPYIFTGIGSDTLRINGLPRMPTRSGAETPAYSEPLLLRSPESHENLTAVRNDAWNAVKHIKDRAIALDEYLRIVRDDSRVEWAEIQDTSIRLLIRGAERPVVIQSPLGGQVRDGVEEVDFTRRHESEIFQFERLLEIGVFFAFGNGYVMTQEFQAAKELRRIGSGEIAFDELATGSVASFEGASRFASDVDRFREGKAATRNHR